MSNPRAKYFKGGRSVLCTFIKSRLGKYTLTIMCNVLKVNRSGFYAWLHVPESMRIQEDKRLIGRIKHFWLESGCVYGYRNLTLDLHDDGENCGKNQIYRIMKAAKIKAIRGYNTISIN